MTKTAIFFPLSLLLCTLLVPFRSLAQNTRTSYVFIENKGQWGREVEYAADIPGGRMFISARGINYSFVQSGARHGHEHGGAALRAGETAGQKAAGIQVDFVGANSAPRVTVEGTSETRYNYYLGKDVTTWAPDCRAYSTLTYHDLYPYIDLKFYSQGENLKYDLVLKPGADPAMIQFRYTGQDSIWLSGGSLIADARISAVIENTPVAYYEHQEPHLRASLACRFKLENGVLGFEFPNGYATDQTIVIDPELIFSTFSGSVSDNFGFTACFDEAGNLYSGGIVFGPNFPITNQSTYGGDPYDMAILKYDSSGRSLLYATFIGGKSADVPHSLIVNNQQELVIMGTTGSANYPTSATAYDTTFNGGKAFGIFAFNEFENGSDIVVSKLGPTGNLIASSYVGGPGNDGVLRMLSVNIYENALIHNYGDYLRGDVIVDADDNIYIASSTDASGFPTTSDALQQTYAGGFSDAVVFSFKSDLNSLNFSTYIGGAQDDAAYSIKLDTEANILIGGGTSSDDFPVTGVQGSDTFLGRTDGFIAKLDNSGSSLLQSIYLGTDREDQVYFIDIDASNHVYAAGQTRGNYPITQGIFNNPNSAQFIHKFTPNLDSTVFSTVFGSGSLEPNISITAFLVNECENIFLSGWGGNVNNFNSMNAGNTFGMQVTPDALFPQTDGSDFYLMALEANAGQLLYATFFGSSNGEGDHVDGGTSRFDKRGIMYQSVCTCGGQADNFPTTPGAWSRINLGQLASGQQRCNNAAFKFDLATLKSRFDTSLPDGTNVGVTAGCAPFSLKMSNTSAGGESNIWNMGDGLVIENTESVVHTFTKPGKYQVSLTVNDDKTCQKQDVLVKEITVYGNEVSVSADASICAGDAVQLVVTGGASYTWSPAESLSNPAIGNPMATPTQTTTYSLIAITPNGCRETESVKVTVLSRLEVDFETNTPDSSHPGVLKGCAPFTVNFKNLSNRKGTSRVFTLGDGSTIANTDNFNHTFEATGTYQVTLTVKDTGLCTDEESVTKTITVVGDETSLSQDVIICEGESTPLLATGGTSYQWTPALGLSSATISNPVAAPQITTTYKVRIGTPNGCVVDDSLRVIVRPILVADFETNTIDRANPGLLSGCAPISLNFKNTGKGGTSRIFDLGNSTTFENVDDFDVFFETPGVYNVHLTLKDPNSCNLESTTSQVITIYGDKLDISPDQVICLGESVPLVASGGTGFQWSPTDGLSDAHIANPIATPTKTTTYTARSISPNGCALEKNVKVTVLPLLVAGFDTNTPQNNQPGIVSGCRPLTLSFINTSIGGSQWQWDFGDGTFVANATSINHTFEEIGTYQVTLRITDAGLCTDEEIITREITVFGEEVYISPDAAICDGASIQLLAAGGASYVWSPTTGLDNPLSASPIASPLVSTTYSVRITSINGCDYDRSVHVVVIPNIVEDFSFERIEKCLDPPVYIFTNHTQNANSSIWDLGDGTTSSAKAIQHTYAADGTYIVGLNTTGDCVVDKEEVIEYQAFIVPNAFSPNGDGINDFFEVRTERGVQLRVLDRAGREVYRSNDYRNEWNGGGLTVGTYFYTLTFDDGETCQGWVKLLR